MSDLSFAECKSLYAEREITGHRIAVSSVESCYIYSVAALGQNIFQRYTFFQISQLLSCHKWRKAWSGNVLDSRRKSSLLSHIGAYEILLHYAMIDNGPVLCRDSFRVIHS